MPLTAGDINASNGMSKEIFEMIKTNMAPFAGDSPPAKTLEAWKALANAIAVGVTKQLALDFATMQTAPDGPEPHTHPLQIST